MVWVLFAAAAVQAGQGLWIPAKAALAQQLLERAWTRSAHEHAIVKPWPWADTWPVARLSSPRLGEAAVVLAGASGEALAFGPGLVTGSARPGEPGNAVIAGHRDTHFAFIEALLEGDRLVLEAPGGQRQDYTVAAVEIVDSRVAVIQTESAEPWLTLVSCWPFDAVAAGGPLRYVVSARAGGGPAPAPAVLAWNGGAQDAGHEKSEIGAEAVAQAAHEDRRQQQIRAAETFRDREGGGRTADVRL